MSDITTSGKPREITMQAVVIRADGTREDLGTVAYWHRNPLRRIARRFKTRNRR